MILERRLATDSGRRVRKAPPTWRERKSVPKLSAYSPAGRPVAKTFFASFDRKA
jgi:hypothetical protein